MWSVQIALFAGRRSSDRAYLLLQTWFCAQHLKAYIGTSSIYAVSHLNRALEAEGVHDTPQRRQQIGLLLACPLPDKKKKVLHADTT